MDLINEIIYGDKWDEINRAMTTPYVPRDPFGPGGLTPQEMILLAVYDAEVLRGVVHTAEWDTLMQDLRERTA